MNDGDTYTPDFFVPGSFVSISNVADEGLDYFNANGTDPSDYLFWDDVHPTLQGHQVVAGLVLAAIPEPSPWALLPISGIVLLLWHFRKSAIPR
ncbi:MAG: hypothetical protein ABI254_12865 [Chthoniobacterales bacterium]